ncbi:MAG: tripartite tricarboxylate transporter TctB family protein [Deltaproteobacteria bacterium]|nr:tripartite tricarboxylate transporter TctB family protein [Deltaproteobacteria bacterium]
MVTAWSSTSLSMGKASRPGPGFLPFGLAIILIGLSIALIAKSWKKEEQSVPFWPERGWVRPVLGVGVFLLYALLLPPLGFVFTTFFFLIFWMWIIERIRWVTILPISIGVTAVLFLIFSYFLEVPLPAGFLG